jgi:small GTP-binding protein
MKEINIKFVLVGDSGVGKSTFLKRKVEDVYYSSFLSTIGVDFNTQYFIRKNYKIRTSIWDTAGQEKFSSLIEVYYRNLTAGLIFYDTTNKKSFENIQKWLNRVKKNNENLPVYIIGTKTDLNEEREIFISDLEPYKSQQIMCFECSSKINFNINEIFESIIDDIFNKIKKKELLPFSNNGIKVYNNNFRKVENLEISDTESEHNNTKPPGCCTIL